MRSADGPTYTNEIQSKFLAEQVGRLTHLPTHLSMHIMYLVYLTIMNGVACEARDSEGEKLKSFDIEIPYIGKMSLELVDKDIRLKNMEFEDQFKTLAFKAVNEGYSEILDVVKETYIDKITNKYKELI